MVFRHFFKHLKIHVRDGVMTLLTPPVLWCLGGVTPNGARRIANAIAAIGSRLPLQAWKKGLDNLAVAFPEKTADERTELARKALSSMVLTGLELVRILKHPDELLKMVNPLPKELMDACLGQAAIICLPHLGNWEVFGQAVPFFGLKVAAVAEPLGNRPLNERLVAARERTGLQIIPRIGAARKVLHALHEKKNVGLLVDQNVSPRDGGIFANFFGLPVTMSPLPAALARKLDISLTVAASVRRNDGHFDVVCRKLPQNAAAYSSDEALSQDILHAFEMLVREYPEQYTWFYHRWQYIPQNLPEELEASYPPYARKRPYAASENTIADAVSAAEKRRDGQL